MLAPNAPLRAAVTAMAPECVAHPGTKSPSEADEPPESTPKVRCRARHLWAVPLARIFEAFPLTCPHCASEIRIIAFVTDPAAIAAILAHIGEATRPPRVAPTRDPPARETDAGASMDPQAGPAGIDPLAQPEPESEYIFDQRITW